MKRRNNRREFLVSSIQTLGALGVSSNVIGMFLGSVYNRAFAQSAKSGVHFPLNSDGFRYVFVSLAGAPPRWFFDMLPTPNGASDSYIPGGFGNAYDISGSKVNVINKTYLTTDRTGKKIYLPPVWGMGTSSANFTDLLPHTLFIRGMDMEINSHVVSNARQVAPILGGNSIHGVIADKMESPIAAIINGSPSGASFKSAKGLGTVMAASTGNPITGLISAFKSIPDNLSYRADSVKPVVDQFLDRMDSYARQNRIPASSLREALGSADQLIRINIDTLADSWQGLNDRYLSIVNEALHPNKGTLPGVFDKAVPSTPGDKRYRYDNNDSDKLLSLGDARDLISEGTHKNELARQFALTEFLLTTGICSVVDISGGGGVLNAAKVTSTGSATIPCDQHGVGCVVSVIASTMYYRALLASMTELVRNLKKSNLFGKTILHISAEFNRIPRSDGSGSDHGVSGSSATLISGMFNDVAFIGNIKKGLETGNNQGTRGNAADWDFGGGNVRPIKVNDIARSITAMTNSTDIVANGFSLVKPLGNGLWVPKVSGGNNV